MAALLGINIDCSAAHGKGWPAASNRPCNPDGSGELETISHSPRSREIIRGANDFSKQETSLCHVTGISTIRKIGNQIGGLGTVA